MGWILLLGMDVISWFRIWLRSYMRPGLLKMFKRGRLFMGIDRDNIAESLYI